MGAIISRWRKKPSTVEQLEALDKEISSHEKRKLLNLQSQRHIIGTFVIWSIFIYIIGTVVLYFLYFPPHWGGRVLFTTPVLFFPILIWLLKKLLHWYFVKRISSNNSKLEELRTKKKEILEEVMENETYKKAKEILEKFDPDRFKQLEKPASVTPVMRTPQGQDLRLRTPGTARQQGTPSLPRQQSLPSRGVPFARNGQPLGELDEALAEDFIEDLTATPSTNQNGNPVNGPGGPAPGPPLPRPVLPRERTTLDKFVEYLVGDGPQNRYALICKRCMSHNGMALREEFDYIAFRCCYCHFLNQARKNRPNAPKLEPATPIMKYKDLEEEEGSLESGSGSDSGSLTPSEERSAPIEGSDATTATTSLTASDQEEPLATPLPQEPTPKSSEEKKCD